MSYGILYFDVQVGSLAGVVEAGILTLHIVLHGCVGGCGWVSFSQVPSDASDAHFCCHEFGVKVVSLIRFVGH
jgi:hypothetical protein